MNDPIDSPLSVTGDGSQPANWIFSREDTFSSTLSDMGTMDDGFFGGSADGENSVQENDGSNSGDRQPPENMEMSGEFPGGNGPSAPGGRFPDGLSAEVDVTALTLSGGSVLVLLAGLWIALQFKRAGGVPMAKRTTVAAPDADSERLTCLKK